MRVCAGLCLFARGLRGVAPGCSVAESFNKFCIFLCKMCKFAFECGWHISVSFQVTGYERTAFYDRHIVFAFESSTQYAGTVVLVIHGDIGCRRR